MSLIERSTCTPSSVVLCTVVTLASSLLLFPFTVNSRTGDATIEQAYAYNREGMIAMSKARFVEAIAQFEKAADLVPDYGITSRGLRYTPNFMMAWAYEKLGHLESACHYYRTFLDLAPAKWTEIETEKAGRAETFVDHHCPALGNVPEPWL